MLTRFRLTAGAEKDDVHSYADADAELLLLTNTDVRPGRPVVPVR